MQHGRYRFIVGFLAAPVLLYVVFVISPYVQAFYIALTNWKGVSANPQFIGLENFSRLLDDEVFWAAVRHHGVLLLVMPLVTIVIALFFSFLLNLSGGQKGGQMSGIWGSKVYRVIFFLPQVLAVAIVGVLFQTIYRPDETGVINGLLGKVGIDPVGWLIDPNIALLAIIGVMVWQAVGFYVVLFSAGMSSIPKDVFEAAALDGAGRYTLFFKITLPLLWDTMQVAWVYLGIAAFDAFALVQVLSVDRGGPDNSTTVLPLEIWRTAFNFSKFGYASAMGVALFFMTITFAALTLRVTRRERIEF
ncbi:carbohydrate ABC transporter permease [Streptosporangium roseum]|jgi:N-acetylglucosamine transport system permease protein|uniref:Sugar ABC transporter permease protein n=1 Tax=Streptosporangium roseum (strain ATCC 12428 / DSM 43021 / JCM 3005 / KCTC 9067 / NCIMB 10171 / NRRL 2505 / NI 9100) TaxID=479432 RepID=D2ARN7_STRRD|nr:sugar ABC transporter permease [Streptosporangium roseum]ACZ90377.1 sugar ABC transporter permease protein [Streptosporangium roseum DSM 43021]